MGSLFLVAVGGFDKHIDLLADIKRRIRRAGQRVYDLQDAGVHPLGAGAGERNLGYHIGLDAHEFERKGDGGIAFQVSERRLTRADAGGVLLVDVGAENLDDLEKWVGAKLQREITVPDLSAFGYRSQGGRLLLIGRRPAAQFFYAGENQELVQLVIGFTDQPDRGGRLDQRDEINVVSWREKGYVYAFIGRIDGQRLWRMADASWAKLKPA